MHYVSFESSLFLATVIFMSVIFLHLVRKNTIAVWLYVLQSAAVAFLLLAFTFGEFSPLLLIATLATILVKLIVAPYFFFKLIREHQLKFSASTYLGMPLTLLLIAALAAFAKLNYLTPLTTLVPAEQTFLFVSLATILSSLFLVINRKGALSQMIGILSLENGIVSFAFFAGLEQSAALQLGISFDVLIWILIATIFGSMMYRQFGSLDVSEMKKLIE